MVGVLPVVMQPARARPARTRPDAAATRLRPKQEEVPEEMKVSAMRVAPRISPAASLPAGRLRKSFTKGTLLSAPARPALSVWAQFRGAEAFRFPDRHVSARQVQLRQSCRQMALSSDSDENVPNRGAREGHVVGAATSMPNTRPMPPFMQCGSALRVPVFARRGLHEMPIPQGLLLQMPVTFQLP